MTLQKTFTLLFALAFMVALPSTSFAQIVREPTVSAPSESSTEETDTAEPTRTRRTSRTATSSNRRTETETTTNRDRRPNNPCAPGWGRSNNNNNQRANTRVRTQRRAQTTPRTTRQARTNRGFGNRQPASTARTNRNVRTRVIRNGNTVGTNRVVLPQPQQRSRVTASAIRINGINR